MTLSLLVANSAAAQTPAPPARYGIELIVRTAENFRQPEDVAQFVAAAARHGVDTIALLVKQDENNQIPSGSVYYQSRLAPVAAGYEHFDVLATMLQAAHSWHMRVRAWMPMFHDQVAAHRHPDWQMRSLQAGQVLPYTGTGRTEYFVNPLHPEAQAYELSLIEEVVRHYPVDGVMLDWIRFDNFNMDLSNASREQYRALHGTDPLRIDFDRDSDARDRWNAFRTDALAAYVKRVRAVILPPIDLGIYILPPEFVEVGQDAGKFNQHTALLAPMCYFRDWGFELSWFWSSCLASTVTKAGRASVVPAMDASLPDDHYQAIFAHLRNDFPQITRIAWFHHGEWSERLMRRVATFSGGQDAENRR